MYASLSSLILTVAQVLLVAGLPKPEAIQSTVWVEIVVDDCNTASPVIVLTTTFEADYDPRNGSPRSMSETVTTVVNPGPSVNTVTLTALPATQTPTVSSGLPDTTGSVDTSLQTDGHPSSLPFPTSVPSISESTLTPLDTTYTSISATEPSQTVTIPISTFSSVITSATVTNVAVETPITVTAVTTYNVTVTSNGNTYIVPSAGTTVITTNVTALVPTTLTASSTESGTISITLTTNTLTDLPTATPSCVFPSGCSGQNAFEPIGLEMPPANIQARGGHPVPRLGVNATGPIETNKFYANFFLGSQASPAFAMPYSLTWSKGTGNAGSWGMAVSHVEKSQIVFGPADTAIPGSPDHYYINPIAIQSIILSASELGSSTVLTTDSPAMMSVNVNLQPISLAVSRIEFPMVSGMGFVTGIYTSLQPEIQTSVFFSNVSAVPNPKPNVFKWRCVLDDGHVWLIYATPAVFGLTPNFNLTSSTLLQGVTGWSGVIQVAKVPNTSFEPYYDAAAGLYPTSGNVAGYASGSTAEYSLSWQKAGQYADNGTLLMYALPHHLQSFNNQTSSRVTLMQLETTTTGLASAVVADYWVMEENIPISMDFAPWSPTQGSVTSLPAAAISAIQDVAAVEASQNMSAQTDLDSMYYSGKALSKFATIVYTMHDLAGQQSLANSALEELKQAYSVFVNNTQIYPLVYDDDWKGVVSSATYVTGNDLDDFGNTLYNDHHFHYGYFLHAAAVIGYLDPSWVPANRDYVNALARDVSNPSSLDSYFPVFRSFDWYHGHSWAKGLFESADGKDEESSSEDSMFAYGLKMWGKTVGDTSMEARGNLMLAVLARSLQSYFLLESDNTNQPAEFIGNKVTGILFENKADHTTYFGTNYEYIQGIHMLPLEPFSTLTRTSGFVTQEWNTYFAESAVDPASNVSGGWRGILYANLAIIDPSTSYSFFTQSNFDYSWIDGGASRTWYIAMAAGLGGAGGD